MSLYPRSPVCSGRPAILALFAYISPPSPVRSRLQQAQASLEEAAARLEDRPLAEREG